jgi:Holliday junction resolvasome RuvABC DNA-binding subunit
MRWLTVCLVMVLASACDSGHSGDAGRPEAHHAERWSEALQSLGYDERQVDCIVTSLGGEETLNALAEGKTTLSVQELARVASECTFGFQ